jgi:long-subunit fatty acid transport protein
MIRPKESLMRHAVASAILAASLLLTAVAPRDARAAGETGFVFLKIGVGARAMGMGSAFVALADDPTSVYWNPAGLASIEKTQVTVMHNEWILDFRQEFVAVGTQLGPGTVGFGFSGFYSDELERRSDTGVLEGHYGANDIAFTGAYGLRLGTGLDAGLGVRYIREMIDQVDATTIAADLGARYRVSDSGFMLGAAVSNIGGNAKFDSEEFSIPLTWRAGAAWSKHVESLRGSGTLSAEYRQAKQDDGKFHVGGEYAYHDRVALRVGGAFGYDDQDLTFGLGLMKDWFRFDYALVPFSSDLGSTHVFSLTGSF